MTGRILSWILVFLFVTASAWAARVGTLTDDDVDVYINPNSNSLVIETLKKNATVVVSNLPVQGFYKARTPSGKIGWIAADVISLGPAPVQEEVDDAVHETFSMAKPGSVHSWVRFRLMGDLNFYTSPNIVTNVSSLGPGYGVGGEVVVMLGSTVGLVFRGETAFKTTVINDSNSGKTFQIDVGSIPLYFGTELTIVEGSVFSVYVSAMGGVGLQTTLTSTDRSDTSNNVFTSSALAFSGLGKLDLHIQVAKAFSIFAEGGYRYLQSPTITTTGFSGYGILILQNNFVVNLSGPFAGAGVSVKF